MGIKSLIGKIFIFYIFLGFRSSDHIRRWRYW